MRKTNRLTYSLLSICSTLFLVACASQPTEAPAPATTPAKILSGDVMLRDSQGLAQLSNRWKEGKQKVDKGTELQHKGQAEIDQGQALIDEGQKIMRESEEGYKTLRP